MQNATTEHPPDGGRKRLFLKVVFFGGVPILLVAMFASYRSFLGYVEHDPDFCAQCHVAQIQYALWGQGEHHDIPCQECHQQTTAQALDTLKQFVQLPAPGQPGPRPRIHSPKVPVNACIRCHKSQVRDWPQIGGSIGHEVHLRSGKITCKSCHGRSIHKFGAALDACADCHPQQVVRGSGMEKLHCNACHNFLNKSDTLIPTRRVCLDCHAARSVAMPEYPKDKHMARFACAVCHLPHKGKEVAAERCRDCHEGIERHGLHSTPAHGQCEKCHEAHTWIPTRKHCLSCHGRLVRHCPDQACWSCHDMSDTRGATPPAPP